MKTIKIVFSFILLLCLVTTIVPTNSKAEEIDPIITNTTEFIFAPESELTNEIQPLGLSFARGFIGCRTVGKDTYCDWNIQVGGDVINYSNVKVIIEKNHGLFGGGWKHYTSTSYNWPVNPPLATIRNQAHYQLPKGSYRAKLGGTFTTVKNGVYSAIANGHHFFEVK